MAKVFIHFLTQVFTDLTTKQLQKMISQLPPIEETLVGKELIGKGREEASEAIVIAQISARFPEFSDEQESKIRDLECSKLKELAIALLDFESLKELENWLEL